MENLDVTKLHTNVVPNVCNPQTKKTTSGLIFAHLYNYCNIHDVDTTHKNKMVLHLSDNPPNKNKNSKIMFMMFQIRGEAVKKVLPRFDIPTCLHTVF